MQPALYPVPVEEWPELHPVMAGKRLSLVTELGDYIFIVKIML